MPEHFYPCPGRKQEFLTSDKHTPRPCYRKSCCARKHGVWLPSLLTAAHHCRVGAHVLSAQPLEACLLHFHSKIFCKVKSRLLFEAWVTLQKSVVCAFLIYSAGCCQLWLWSKKLRLDLRSRCARTVLWPGALLTEPMSLLLALTIKLFPIIGASLILLQLLLNYDLLEDGLDQH